MDPSHKSFVFSHIDDWIGKCWGSLGWVIRWQWFSHMWSGGQTARRLRHQISWWKRRAPLYRPSHDGRLSTGWDIFHPFSSWDQPLYDHCVKFLFRSWWMDSNKPNFFSPLIPGKKLLWDLMFHAWYLHKIYLTSRISTRVVSAFVHPKSCIFSNKIMEAYNLYHLYFMETLGCCF